MDDFVEFVGRMVRRLIGIDEFHDLNGEINYTTNEIVINLCLAVIAGAFVAALAPRPFHQKRNVLAQAFDQRRLDLVINWFHILFVHLFVLSRGGFLMSKVKRNDDKDFFVDISALIWTFDSIIYEAIVVVSWFPELMLLLIREEWKTK